ncbi:MAG: LemA family protein [Firmicutes bacterium]|nr:LemA family protein [Bacillota bacterium]
MKKSFLVVIAIVLILALSGFSSYNRLVSMDETISGKWGQVENQLQRRSDLIPNLVETVKGFAAHEEKVLSDVAEARAKLAGAQTVQETAEANAELSSALSRLLVVVENYPTLKADANFRQLQDELAGTENRIATARMDYNTAVEEYNKAIRRFPTVIWARLLGFEPKDYFQAEEDAHKVPKVDFSK